MNNYIKLFLIFSLSSINCSRAPTNSISALRARETGIFDKKTFKKNHAIFKITTIEDLRQIESSYEFLRAIPEELFPKEDELYQDNNFMHIIPRALKDQDIEFKHSVFGHILRGIAVPDGRGSSPKQRAHCRFMIMALVKAGVNVNLRSREMLFGFEPAIAHIDEDDNFAREILAQGADANTCITFFEREPGGFSRKKFEGNWTPLCKVKTVKIAALLVNYGAQVNNVSKVTGKTFLHQATEEEYEPELLKFYIQKGIDVNAVCRKGLNALDYLVRYFYYCRRDLENLKQKIGILLDAGSKSRYALRFARINSGDAPELDIVTDIILQHQIYCQEAARLRNISINVV